MKNEHDVIWCTLRLQIDSLLVSLNNSDKAYEIFERICIELIVSVRTPGMWSHSDNFLLALKIGRISCSCYQATDKL